MEELIVAFSVSALLIAACLYLHFKALRNGARIISELGAGVRRQMLLVMTMIFLTHLLEIVIFAIAIWAMAHNGVGSLSGAHTSTVADFFYFSIASYTTLGIGDITPEGPIRVVVGIEALTGLLLIAWSASFTYLTMERIWAPETD
ncbi:two pore domain potassium channel family protein [Parasphingorhabdus halotolerans]|uniref:Two pore domain potassium channel family protein n=1 Tax=Parasphingorhabdus halotolerans TaxID=2725558 RepID=A0A6H2DJZ5_9SPHN|nr:two pore domain potassium channel family protein [Parasphingorhabdus halotolerans]QJB68518.1 two pore domain potassium channel family protein [Parasphingorhabdus halotolerans]